MRSLTSRRELGRSVRCTFVNFRKLFSAAGCNYPQLADKQAVQEVSFPCFQVRRLEVLVIRYWRDATI